MKFLTRLGQVIARATTLVLGISSLLPNHDKETDKVVYILEAVAAVVMNAEVIGQLNGLTGEQKLKGATPLVAQILMQSNMLSGKKIHNLALFQQGAEKITSGIADILNSIKADEVHEENIT